MTETRNVLVLGGTAWLGGEVARAAAADGARVTCLARGVSGTVPDGVRLVAADRREPTAYDEVRRERWDEVVDVSWQPGMVRSALAALAERAAHWTYVSSGSAYARDDEPGADESAATHEPLAGDEASRETYGPAKVACELACADAVGDRLLVARVGLIGGPGDGSDRFGYWPARFALAAERGDGPVLVPDAAAQSTQTIDVRDLAAWLVDSGRRRTMGTFNVVGERTPLGDVLDLAREAAGYTGDVVTADPGWLLEQGVDFWMGEDSLPLWLPGPDYAGHSARSDAAAVAAGLVRRPLAETVADSLAWERALGLDRDRKAGLGRDRELALIDMRAPSLAPLRQVPRDT